MRLTRLISAPFRLTIGESVLYQRIRHRLLFRGLQVGDGAQVNADGEFVFGAGASVGRSSIVLVEMGRRLVIGERSYVGRYCEIAPDKNIEIGDDTSIQDRSVILGNVRIGRYCIFAYNTYLSSGTHRFNAVPAAQIKDQDRMAAQIPMGVSTDIEIGDDCWIGNNVVIMPGVSIGKGCVIGANAVVTEGLPPYSVAVGAPARVIKKRLNFLPPCSVQYDVDADLPYFYSGFLTSQSELSAARSNRAIHAHGDFSVFLRRAGTSNVHVRARRLCAHPVDLWHGQSQGRLTSVVGELDFPLSEGEGPLLFTVRSGTGLDRVAVEKIWVT